MIPATTDNDKCVLESMMDFSTRRSLNTYGGNGGAGSQAGSLRNRRKDRYGFDDLSDEDGIGSSRSSPHPLLPNSRALDDTNNDNRTQSSLGQDVPIPNFDEISRPSLFRLTSDLEREVQAAHVISRSSVDEMSARGSLDLRRSSSIREPPKEVEVIVHEIQPRESLQGIALRYGIELATLRKVNKLWPTDPLHLRRQLYVPLGECRWAKASDSFVRGPGEGETTIYRKESKSKKGTSAHATSSNVIDASMPQQSNGTDIYGAPYTDKGKGREIDYEGATSQISGSPSIPLPKAGPKPFADGQVLSVLRIPASELSFFPKNKAKSNRTSLDAGIHDTIKRSSSPGSPRNSASTAPRTVSSPSSLRNSIESLTRPFGGRINSMTPIDETGTLHSNPDSSQPSIELLPRRKGSNVQAKIREPARKSSSGWSLNFFSVADDGLDPKDIGKIRI